MVTLTALTPTQQRVIAAIREAQARGLQPSVRDLTSAIGVRSTGSISYQLDQLEAKGLIRRVPGASRAVTLVESEPPALLTVPLLGEIQAGAPIPVPDEASHGEFGETVELGASLVRGTTDDLFALRVKGQSMIDALIDDGDIIVLRAAETCENGATAAVRLLAEGETTLKRIFWENGGRVRLQPANPTMPPFFTPANNLRVQGRVVAVIRQL